MGNLTLSSLQKKQYAEIKEKFVESDMINLDDADAIRLKEVLFLLESLGYIQDMEIDNGNIYRRIGNFSDFEAWHKDQEREERKLSMREWKIGIIGALIGLIPFFVTTVYPWVISLFQK